MRITEEQLLKLDQSVARNALWPLTLRQIENNIAWLWYNFQRGIVNHIESGRDLNLFKPEKEIVDLLEEIKEIK